MTDIIITEKGDRAKVSGVTPKGIEWILTYLFSDEPEFDIQDISKLKVHMLSAGLNVEVVA